MNIGLFTETFTPEISGVVSSIETLREALEKRGHKVYVFTASRPDAAIAAGVLRLPSMPFLLLRSHRFAVVYTPKAARFVGKVKLDVIHTHTEFSLGLFGKLMGLTFGIPVVHTYHTMYKDYTHYVTKGHFNRASQDIVKLFSRSFCSGCSIIVAPSEKVAQLLISYGVKRPIRIVPSGLRIDRFMAAALDQSSRERSRTEFGIPPETPLLVFVGRVAKEKSIGMLLEAMPLILHKVPNAKLLIVGDGPEKIHLEEQAQRLGLAERVIFGGSRPWNDIPDCYRAGDIFVSASATETQGLTVLEAMAAGVPVLARNDPSYASMIDDGVSGLLFETAAELAELSVKLFNDKPYSDSLAEAASKAVKQFSSEEFGKTLEDIYKQAKQLPLPHPNLNVFRIVGEANNITGKLKSTLADRLKFRYTEKAPRIRNKSKGRLLRLEDLFPSRFKKP